MSDSKERLIEAATRPFSDNAEMKLAAARLLTDLAIPNLSDAEVTIARWDALDARPYRPWWQATLWALLLGVSVTILLRDYQEIGRYVAWREWIGGGMTFASTPEPPARFTRNLTHEQTLLLGGDPKLPRREALWHLHPDDPAYFAEYAVEYANQYKSLPPDFLETARRLDAENAWFTYFAASVESKGALENKSVEQTDPDGKVRNIDTWTVLDQARVDRSSALIKKAQSQSRFENYSNELLLKRQALFPVRNRIELMDGVGSISTASISPNIKLTDAAYLQVARSRLAAEAGDVAGFQDACQNGNRFLRHLAEGEAGTLLSGVIEIGYLAMISKAFAEESEKLGLDREAARWKALSEASQARKTAMRSNVFLVAGKVAEPQLVGSTLFGNSFEVAPRAVRSPPVLTDADLKPGRMLDHEILSRFCGYVTWMLMGFLLLGVTAYRFRVAPLASRLAKRMEQVLIYRDWAWLLGAGIILPLAYVMTVNRLTPLGGHQFGMIGNAMLLPMGHFLGLIMLWLVVPLQIARWRLSKRIAWLSFPRTSWPEWLATGTAVAFVPLIGWAGITRSFAPFWANWMEKLNVDLSDLNSADGPWRWWLAVGVLAMPVFRLGFCVCRAALTSSHRQVYHATTTRILSKMIPAAMILIAFSTMAFKEFESSWFQRDRMNRWDPAKPGWTAYEADIAGQLKKELREILGDEP